MLRYATTLPPSPTPSKFPVEAPGDRRQSYEQIFIYLGIEKFEGQPVDTTGMKLRLVGVLLLIPLLDVMVLVLLATTLLSPLLVVALVVLTALVGLLLVRAEGRRTLARLQRKVARGEVPTDELLDGAMLLVAGAFFLTPGIVTDLVGLVLVLPPTRYPFRVAVKKYVVTPYVDARTEGFATGEVYTGGFPGPESSAASGDSPVDVDEDDYRFEDADEDGPTGDDTDGRGDHP